MDFKDHFSGHAALYRDARPLPPADWFDWLAQQAPDRALAWDAGCGNGQASLGLAAHGRVQGRGLRGAVEAVVVVDGAAGKAADLEEGGENQPGQVHGRASLHLRQFSWIVSGPIYQSPGIRSPHRVLEPSSVRCIRVPLIGIPEGMADW